MYKTRDRQKAFLALLLSVPAASIGVATVLYIAPGAVGQILSLLCYIWLGVMSLSWFIWVDGGKIHLQLPKRRELLVGTLLGLLMFGLILGAYWFLGQHWIFLAEIRHKAQQIGISNLNIYLIGSIYSVLFNSLFEEFVWRGFVFNKCRILIPGQGAIWLSAIFFTLHHTLGLIFYINDWRIVVLGSLSVLIAGAIWSWSYLTTRSIWPNYISHALADLALAIIGWQLLFG